MQVLTEIQTRGVKDIYIASIDGLKGSPEAIKYSISKTKIKLCIVHIAINSLKAVTADLKNIYKSVTAEEAYMELDNLLINGIINILLSEECGKITGKIYLLYLLTLMK